MQDRLRMRLFLALVFLCSLLGASSLPAAPAAGPALAENRQALLQQIKPRLSPLAAKLGVSSTQLESTVLRSPDLHWDHQFGLHYGCRFPAPPRAAAAARRPASLGEDDAFALHSKSGAPRQIYLDFDGHTTSGTAWNATFTGGLPITSTPFDMDGTPATFSVQERQRISEVWAQVAEDFAPFDVDVTTQAPSDGWSGMRVVISPTSSWYPSSAGGVAYIGVFGSSTPCFVFTDTSNDGKFIAEAGSHETGHTLGLLHDGLTNGTEYYEGQGNWAPIMGVGYYVPITQWSAGEYANANNLQDDLAVITANGLTFRTDDHGGDQNSATQLLGPTEASGVIETRQDQDVFAIVATPGLLTADASPAALSPNLGIRLELRSGSGTLVATAEGPGLATTLKAPVSSGTYYLKVEGVGAGNPLTNGYSDYASLGQYRLQLRTENYSLSGVVTASGAPLPGVSVALRSVQYDTADVSPNLSVPDASTRGVTSTLTVPNWGVIEGLKVSVQVNHSHFGDLELTLRHPSGTTVRLRSATPEGTGNLVVTYPNPDTPAQSLDLLKGKPSAGNWQLVVKDRYTQDTGVLLYWSLGFADPDSVLSTAATDQNGRYSFTDLLPEDYQVAPVDGSRNYSPASRLVILRSEVTDAHFSALAPPKLLSLKAKPATVKGGKSVTLTVKLNSPAPPDGLDVTLESTKPTILTLPTTLRVAGSASSATVTATTVRPPKSASLKAKAGLNGAVIQTKLTVRR